MCIYIYIYTYIYLINFIFPNNYLDIDNCADNLGDRSTLVYCGSTVISHCSCGMREERRKQLQVRWMIEKEWYHNECMQWNALIYLILNIKTTETKENARGHNKETNHSPALTPCLETLLIPRIILSLYTQIDLEWFVASFALLLILYAKRYPE